MLVSGIIKEALEIIGVIASGETPNSSDSQTALTSLNMMISSLSNDNLVINKYVREIFPLTGGKGVYTMGVGGDFNTERPIEITKAASSESVSGSNPSNYTVPLEFPVRIQNIQRWAEVQIKTMQSTLVTDIYPDGNFALLNINVYPVPSQQNGLILYSKKPLGEYANVNDDIILPPGYQEMLSYNLAKRLCPKFGRSMTPESAEIAVESLARIKRTNTQPVYMKSDAPTTTKGRGFNIYTGENDI